MEEKKFKTFFRTGPGIALGVIGAILVVLLLGLLFGAFIMMLWNWLMPSLFGIKSIGYWEAVGIFILAKIILSPAFPPMKGGKHHRPWKDCDSRDWEEWGPQEEWKVHGSWKNWKYYKNYWREEGKAAFEKYIEKKEAGNNPDGTNPPGEPK